MITNLFLSLQRDWIELAIEEQRHLVADSFDAFAPQLLHNRHQLEEGASAFLHFQVRTQRELR